MRRKEDRTSQILALLVQEKKIEVAELSAPESTALQSCPAQMISRVVLPITMRKRKRSRCARQSL